MMNFSFRNGSKLTEALVTGMKYHKDNKRYEIAVLGLDDDGFSYTVPGTAWFDCEDFDEMIEAGEFEFPHQLIGKRLKLVSETYLDNNANEIDENDNESNEMEF